MTRSFTFSLALAALFATLAPEADAQVTASSYSNGGTAISSASGRGNTRLNASSYASGGGYARATMTGSGTNGGFASGNSTASSRGGVAISNGRSVANGWGARSHANSRANSFRGFARSDSTAIANGNFAQAGSDSRANAFYNYSRSNARAVDNQSYYGQPYSSSGMSSPSSSGTQYTNFGPGSGGAPAANISGGSPANLGNASPASASGSMQTQIITSGRSGNVRSFGSRAAAFIRNR